MMTSRFQAQINLSSATGSNNEIDFLSGVQNLWFEQARERSSTPRPGGVGLRSAMILDLRPKSALRPCEAVLGLTPPRTSGSRKSSHLESARNRASLPHRRSPPSDRAARSECRSRCTPRRPHSRQVAWHHWTMSPLPRAARRFSHWRRSSSYFRSGKASSGRRPRPDRRRMRC